MLEVFVVVFESVEWGRERVVIVNVRVEKMLEESDNYYGCGGYYVVESVGGKFVKRVWEDIGKMLEM